MGDIDQALTRAYARRGPAELPTTPPPPHFPIEPAARPAASTPILEWPPTVLALERGHGDRFDRLADALVHARDRRWIKTVLFTSCHRSEGRSTLLLTLARALARRPGRTLLIDADLSGPMLARLLGLRPRLGLDDLIEQGAATAEAVIDAPDDHLSVLPLRSAVARPREFLASPAWPSVMGRLRHDFDLILVDGGPLFAGLNTPALPRGMDAAILVHNRSLTGARAILRAREALEAGGISLLGLAETFV